MTETPSAPSISASEFTRNFGRYRMAAQRAPVAVSSHGVITGYFIGPDEFEAYQSFRAQRRSFATGDLSTEQIAAIGAARMHDRHEALNALMDQD